MAVMGPGGVLHDVSIATVGWDAGTWLSIAVLIVASATLWFTYPRSAKLDVDRLSELETADLTFMVHPHPNEPSDEPRVPRGYHLALRVAVANVGRRKAVVSNITLDHFTTEQGDTKFLPEAIQGPIRGSVWHRQMAWHGNEPVSENVATPPPYVLSPDDVIVVDFRQKRGCDWRPDYWDLEKLRQYHDELSSPFVAATVTVAWRRVSPFRRGMRVQPAQHFKVKLQVLQQAVYVDALRAVTSDFTVRPEVEVILIQVG